MTYSSRATLIGALVPAFALAFMLISPDLGDDVDGLFHLSDVVGAEFQPQARSLENPTITGAFSTIFVSVSPRDVTPEEAIKSFVAIAARVSVPRA